MHPEQFMSNLSAYTRFNTLFVLHCKSAFVKAWEACLWSLMVFVIQVDQDIKVILQNIKIFKLFLPDLYTPGKRKY